MAQYIIGIDEAGRGALAGPVCVGAVMAPEAFDWRDAFQLVTRRGAPRLRDSKQLTSQQRVVLYEYIKAHDALAYSFAFVDAQTIDAIGIVKASHEAANVAVKNFGASAARARVLLDAGLRVPRAWRQESFIRGDETIPVIALASVIAKVTRDHFMEDAAILHPAYRFDQHKGYGTSMHERAIRTHGFSLLHRRTFCTRIAPRGGI